MMNEADFYKSLPKKRMGAAALFQNEQGEILIVKPTYRAGWLLPGGVVEEDESPKTACEREVQEELGLTRTIGILLSLDYVPKEGYKNEGIQFIFSGGVLSEKEIEDIQLVDGELSEYRFVSLEEAVSLLALNLARRIVPSYEALEGQGAVYLEQGQVVDE